MSVTDIFFIRQFTYAPSGAPGIFTLFNAARLGKSVLFGSKSGKSGMVAMIDMLVLVELGIFKLR